MGFKYLWEHCLSMSIYTENLRTIIHLRFPQLNVRDIGRSGLKTKATR